MRCVYQIISLLIVAFSVWVIVEAHETLRYYTDVGPGPGFFPFWLGLLLGGLSLVWFGQVTLSPQMGRVIDLVPKRQQGIQVIAAIAGIAFFALVVGVLGFQTTMSILLLGLLVLFGCSNLVLVLALSIGGSWALTYLFRQLLEVQLPVSTIDFLRNLGL